MMKRLSGWLRETARATRASSGWRAAQAHPGYSVIGLAAVVVAVVVVVVFGMARPVPDWSRPANVLVPQEVAGQALAATPDSSGLLEQIVSLAPGVSGSAASVADEQGPAPYTVLILNGPQNSLNSVQIRIAQALGAGRKADEWGAAGLPGAPGVAFTYQKSDFKLSGLLVDRVANVNQSGAVVQQWLMIRPNPGLLLAVRDLRGDDGKARDVLAAVLRQAQG